MGQHFFGGVYSHILGGIKSTLSGGDGSTLFGGAGSTLSGGVGSVLIFRDYYEKPTVKVVSEKECGKSFICKNGRIKQIKI